MSAEIQRPFEHKTDTGKVVKWTGVDEEDSARKAADCLGVTIVASRPADRHGIFTLGAGKIIG